MTNRTEAAASASASGSASDNGSSSSSSNNDDKPKRGSARRPSRSRSSHSSKGASNSAEDAEQAETHDGPTAAPTPALPTKSDAQVDEDAEAIDAQTAVAKRQRSSELSGLGLAHLGDGDDSLAPRRSRRAQNTDDASADQDAPDPPLNAPLDDPHYHSTSSSHPPLALATASQLSPHAHPLDIQEAEYIDSEGVTRCICGSDDEDIGLMIQCETCKCWQHCKCMGMPTEEDCPDVYYCEQCRPELHIPLLRDLGVYPNAKSQKKAAARGKESAANQLREAREAVALLTKQNAQRRLDGLAPIATGATRPQRRNTSESHDTPALNAAASPKNPSAPMDSYSAAARKSPKRRSTMNSRDSGWEYIPPGLLLDEDEQQQQEPKKEDEDSAPTADGRKRKRDSRDSKLKRDEETSPSPAASPVTSTDKRRRMSASSSAATLTNARQRRSASDEDKEEGALPRSLSTTTESMSAPSAGVAAKKGKGGAAGKNRSSAAPVPTDENASLLSANKSGSKQPNQYTYRNGKERVLGAASTSSSSANRAVSPTPSPSKSGRRGVASLREGSTMPSRTGTPAPGSGRNNAWNLPEHLSHLASFLPTPTPESLQTTLPTTRGTAGTSRNDANASSSTLSSSRPSPHAFQTVELTEPPTKVRWPSKRTTMAEMRKRVRNMSEWVAKAQSETTERAKRMESLGIRIDFPPCPYPLNSSGSSANQSTSSGSASGTSTANREGAQSPNRSTAQSTDGDVTMQDAAAEGSAANGNGNEQQTGSSSSETPRASVLMMEDIMGDIVDWINRYGATATAAAAVSAPSGSKSANVAAATAVPAAAIAEDEVAEQGDDAAAADA